MTVNVASVAGLGGFPCRSTYTAYSMAWRDSRVRPPWSTGARASALSPCASGRQPEPTACVPRPAPRAVRLARGLTILQQRGCSAGGSAWEAGLHELLAFQCRPPLAASLTPGALSTTTALLAGYNMPSIAFVHPSMRGFPVTALVIAAAPCRTLKAK